MDELLKYIIGIIGVGGSVSVVIYFSMKYLFKKLIDNKFEEKLSNYRNLLAKDFEEYRFNLTSIHNRITKIQDKEFEILPIIWEKLRKIYDEMTSLITPVISPPLDLELMTIDDMKKSINNSSIASIYKNELLKENDKYELYKKYCFRISIDPFFEMLNDFQDYLKFNKIFFDSELFQYLTELEKCFEDVFLGYHAKNIKDDRISKLGELLEIQEKIDPIVEKIEIHIQKRLRFSEA